MLHPVFIKNMVSNRCKLIIIQLFKDFNLQPKEVFLGEVKLESELTKEQFQLVKLRLEQYGYSLITDNGAKIAAKIKAVLTELIEAETFDFNINLSEYIAEKLRYEYHYLSGLFSDTENISIEKYFILLKIEKAKEHLEKGQLNVGEIAYKLGYCSPSHLANQFKQITEMTPTQYKNLIQSNFTNKK